jgi:hypothetical protein
MGLLNSICMAGKQRKANRLCHMVTRMLRRERSWQWRGHDRADRERGSPGRSRETLPFAASTHSACPFLRRGAQMAIGEGKYSYAWNYNSILNNAAPNSGVYAIFNAAVCVYVGEAADIRAKLLEHLKEDTRIIRNAPTRFQWELIPGDQRVARQKQLIVALNPVCNKKMG